MQPTTDRRRFIGLAAASGLALNLRAAGANERVVIGVMGMGGRGRSLADSFEKLPGVEVAAVCDPDQRRRAEAAAVVEKVNGRRPTEVADCRKLFANPDLDAIVVATCNHWHAPAGIAAMVGGKHVYIEKPCSHNPREGEWLVETALKHKRVLQHGTQRRSWPKIVEGIQRARSGDIGRVYYSRSWYANARPSIGPGKPVAVPAWLDFDLWQGPAPRRPYRDNLLHYNWHWFWHWGNGELGNNGVHALDLSRWALDVTCPERVTAAGGRYRWQDAQETADTHVVTYEFPDRRMITWEGLSNNRLGINHSGFGVTLHGEKGSIELSSNGYTLYDEGGKEEEKVPGGGSNLEHCTNFVQAIRGEAKPAAGVLDAHHSSLLCHLGNIALRSGDALDCDPKTGRILNSDRAMAFWERDYEPGWKPRI